MAQVKSVLGDARVRNAMITRFRALAPYEPLSAAVQDIFSGFQQDFPVVDETGKVIGVLTYAGLLKALTDLGPQAPVGDVMSREFETCSPVERLEELLPRLQGTSSPTFPVIENGALIGLLTLNNVSEFVMLRSALQSNAPHANA